MKRALLGLLLALLPCADARGSEGLPQSRDREGAVLAQTSVVRLPAPPGSDPLAGEIQEICGKLAEISGLELKHPVVYRRIAKSGVKEFLEQRIQEEVKPDEIRKEEAALKKLGYVPQDFDLRKTTVELLTEQAAAFYDFRKRTLFLIDTGSEELQHSALVHELAHALADQNFDLRKYIDRARNDDDGSLARMAVMEGQATWLMSEYLTRLTGQSLKNEPVLVRMMARSGEFSTGQYPVFDKAPLYLRASLLFPYTQGMLFQQALVEKWDKRGFREPFRNPPVGTSQVLHPERYFEGAKPRRPALPALDGSWKTYTDGDLGELDHSVLLRQYVGQEEADALAPQLRGGYYRVAENRGDRRMVLVYASAWSTPEAARRFFGEYEKVLKGKWKRYEGVLRADGVLAGRGDDGWFEVRLEGARVTSVEGLPGPR